MLLDRADLTTYYENKDDTPSANWSETATKNFGNEIGSLAEYANEILYFYGKALCRNPIHEAVPLPHPLTKENIKMQLAGFYSIETSDINLLLEMAL